MKTEIKLIGADLEVDQTIRTECPYCRANERTFSVTRIASGLLYTCFRASCEASDGGFVATAGVLIPAEARTREAKLQPYEGDIIRISDADVRFFQDEYELSPTRARMFISRSADGRYILPIAGPHGRIKGYTLRIPWTGAPSTTAYGGPKARVHMHSHEPAQAFYVGPGDRRKLLVVEDQLSAIKAVESGAVGQAVALLGSGGSVKVDSMGGADAVREIASARPHEVIVAFDADATARAFKWARKWGLAFPKVRVAILRRDVKDTKLHDIAAAIGVTE